LAAIGISTRRSSLFTNSTKDIILIHDNGRSYFNAHRIVIGKTEEKTTSYTKRANGRTIHGQSFT
jgi:hypothetical protein